MLEWLLGGLTCKNQNIPFKKVKYADWTENEL